MDLKYRQTILPPSLHSAASSDEGNQADPLACPETCCPINILPILDCLPLYSCSALSSRSSLLSLVSKLTANLTHGVDGPNDQTGAADTIEQESNRNAKILGSSLCNHLSFTSSQTLFLDN